MLNKEYITSNMVWGDVLKALKMERLIDEPITKMVVTLEADCLVTVERTEHATGDKNAN